MLNLLFTYLDNEADERQLTDMFNLYSKQMVFYAMSFLENQDDAEDAVQNVFFNIVKNNWETVNNIENERDLRNYLLKATKNSSLNIIKAIKKDNISLDNAFEFEFKPQISDNSFLKLIENRADYNQVVSAIIKLDDKYKNSLYCHFVLGLSVSRTSRLLGQSLSATQKQLVRGKKILLDLLGIETK